MEWIGQHRNLFSLERHIAEYSSNFGTSGGMQWTSVPCFLWCTGSCFLYWTLAWKLKRAGWIVLSLKIKKTVACLKSPQRQLIVKKCWSQLELNQRHKKFQSFALPTELWDHGTDRRSWTHINGFGDRCSTIELYPYINLEQITGIEPALPAWEAGVLTIERYLHLVLPKRLELLRT